MHETGKESRSQGRRGAGMVIGRVQPTLLPRTKRVATTAVSATYHEAVIFRGAEYSYHSPLLTVHETSSEVTAQLTRTRRGPASRQASDRDLQTSIDDTAAKGLSQIRQTDNRDWTSG